MVFTNRTAKGPSEDSFVRGFGLQSLERTEMGVAVPLRAQERGTRIASLSAGETVLLGPNRRRWWSQHSSPGASQATEANNHDC